MKKAICVMLVFVIWLSAFPVPVFAQGVVGEYTNDEIEFIHLKYTGNAHMLDALFNDDTALGYWGMVNNAEGNGVLKWSIDAASKIIGEYPNKQDYVEILANLIAMQSGDIAEQVQNQSQYDNLKDGTDYAMDIVGIAADFVGGAKLLESVSPIIDAATGGAEVIIDNVEQAKYYETTIRDYSQSKMFLEAVSKHADNEDLRSAAASLLTANDKLLEKRLEYLSDSTAILAEYEAEFFVKNLSFTLLKSTDIYRSDETVKWYVDCGEKLSDSVKAIFAVGTFAFNMVMLAGDIGFGTTDTFSRYQEMKIVSDIAGAIVEANSQIDIPQEAGDISALADIQTKCDYYRMLLSTHARGEYLLYQLLVNDAGILSDFRVLFDYFKDPEDTTDSWYAGQVDCFVRYYDILKNMFATTNLNTLDEKDEHLPTLSDSPYEIYMSAVRSTIASGAWSETLHMTADMLLEYDGAEISGKTTLDSYMDIANYDENDTSKMTMEGHATLDAMGQSLAWDMTYSNGVAHYHYTEPEQTSTNVEMDPKIEYFSLFTEDMMVDADIVGDRIVFSVPGSEIEALNSEVAKMFADVDDIQYGDVDVTVKVNRANNTIELIEMVFSASLLYEGYNADVDYIISYEITSRQRNESTDLAADTRISPEAAVEIYLANKDVWMVNPAYMPMQGYGYCLLDLDFDGVLELISSVNDGSGRYSYNKYYKINAVNSTVEEIQPQSGDQESGVDYYYLSHSSKLLENQTDGTLFYVFEDYLRISATEESSSYLESYMKDGKLYENYLFSEYWHPDYEGKTNDEIREYTFRGQNLTGAEYEERKAAFFEENRDKNVVWKCISGADFDKSDDATQTQLFLDAYRGFSYDGFSFAEVETALVTDTYSYEGTYDGTEFSYRIPKVNLPGATVQEVNAEIYNKLYYDMVKDELDHMSEDVSIILYEMKYDWAVNGDILSILITCNTVWGTTVYYVYNFFMSTGEIAERNDILAHAGFTEEEYTNAAEQAMGSGYLSYYDFDSYSDVGEFSEFHREFLEDTVSKENIDAAIPFLNEDGELCIASYQYSGAEADRYARILNIEDFEVLPYDTVMAGYPAPKSGGVMTYAEYAAAPLGSKVVVEAYVTGTQTWWDNEIIVYAQDADGGYFFYDMTCSAADAAKLVPGTRIKVTGYKNEWAGEVEVTDGTFEILEGTWSAPVMDATSLLGTDELINHQNKRVKFTDMTVESIRYKNDEPGYDIYVTLSKDGANYEFCVEVYLTGPESEVYTAVGALKQGDVVDVEGFLYWYEGIYPHITAISK